MSRRKRGSKRSHWVRVSITVGTSHNMAHSRSRFPGDFGRATAVVAAQKGRALVSCGGALVPEDVQVALKVRRLLCAGT